METKTEIADIKETKTEVADKPSDIGSPDASSLQPAVSKREASPHLHKLQDQK